jgi:PHP family Zn ribbon phosphoesterase
MTPPAIVEAAIRKGLGMIAICDHNACGNAAAVQKAAGRDLAVIAGIEITTVEEVHVVGLFPDTEAAEALSEKVRPTLPEFTEAPRKLDKQLLMNSKGRIWGCMKRMLMASSSLGLSESVKLIKEHEGLAIAAHVNRPAFSVIGQLGMFPKDVHFDAVEMSVFPEGRGLEALPPSDLPVIHSSDSHFLSEIGKCRTEFDLLEATFAELSLALRGIGSRRCYRA